MSEGCWQILALLSAVAFGWMLCSMFAQGRITDLESENERLRAIIGRL